MTPSKIWIFPAAVALTIGHVGYKPKLTGEGFPFPPTYTVVAADQTQSDPQNQVQSEENADESEESVKMSGTQAGDEANTPESDTKKVDQPPTQNPTPGN